MRIEGSQALIEGVAMRASEYRVAIVRRSGGELVAGAAYVRASRFASMPIVRGIIAWLVEEPAEMQWAANVLASESENPVAELPPPKRRSFARIAAGIVLTQATLQLVTYAGLSAFHRSSAPASASFQLAMVGVIFLCGGVYFRIIARISEVHRLFRLNAALKMALWAADEPAEPTPAALRRHPSSWHPRSSVVAYVLIVAVLAPLTVGVLELIPAAHGASLVAHAVTCGVRALLTPIVIGLVDELQRHLAKLGHGPAVRWAFAPFALLDRFVTAAPDEDSIEIAAAALRELRTQCCARESAR